jgi:flagellar hook protein FlgE
MNSIAAIARSGMNAALIGASAAAHNIANLQTPGFRRLNVETQSQPGGGVSAVVTRASQSGDALAADVVGQLLARHLFKANLSVFKTHDAMRGALLDVEA